MFIRNAKNIKKLKLFKAQMVEPQILNIGERGGGEETSDLGEKVDFCIKSLASSENGASFHLKLEDSEESDIDGSVNTMPIKVYKIQKIGNCNRWQPYVRFKAKDRIVCDTFLSTNATNVESEVDEKCVVKADTEISNDMEVNSCAEFKEFSTVNGCCLKENSNEEYLKSLQVQTHFKNDERLVNCGDSTNNSYFNFTFCELNNFLAANCSEMSPGLAGECVEQMIRFVSANNLVVAKNESTQYNISINRLLNVYSFETFFHQLNDEYLKKLYADSYKYLLMFFVRNFSDLPRICLRNMKTLEAFLADVPNSSLLCDNYFTDNVLLLTKVNAILTKQYFDHSFVINYINAYLRVDCLKPSWVMKNALLSDFKHGIRLEGCRIMLVHNGEKMAGKCSVIVWRGVVLKIVKHYIKHCRPSHFDFPHLFLDLVTKKPIMEDLDISLFISTCWQFEEEKCVSPCESEESNSYDLGDESSTQKVDTEIRNIGIQCAITKEEQILEPNNEVVKNEVEETSPKTNETDSKNSTVETQKIENCWVLRSTAKMKKLQELKTQVLKERRQTETFPSDTTPSKNHSTTENPSSTKIEQEEVVSKVEENNVATNKEKKKKVVKFHPSVADGKTSLKPNNGSSSNNKEQLKGRRRRKKKHLDTCPTS